MTFVKIKPIRINKPIENIFEDLFDRSLSDLFDTNFSNQSPSANIIEEDASFKIELAIPGIDKKDVKLLIEEKQLIVSYHKKEVDDDNKGDSKKQYRRKEFDYSSFERKFNLPESINQNAIKATYNNGILIIELSKKEEEKEQPSKTIEIQ
jgi:HSP20 family protein